LQDSRVKFVKATATKIDRSKKLLHTSAGQKLEYDKLVLGLGNVTNYFGIPGLQEYAYGIKSTEEAERFKHHLHEQFIQHGAPDLNYVIVGGGPTGIELAGALPGYLKEVMKAHGIKERRLHIELVEAAPRLLPRMSKEVSGAITKRLRSLGVKIMTGVAVQGATPEMLMAGDKPLKTNTIVWTAGVANHPFFKENNFKLTERGKVEVDDYLQAEQDIYVIGDNANTQYSGLAQTALYDGEFVAKNIEREAKGHLPNGYVPKQPITVIPVGKGWASVQWGKRTFSGYVGWILRSLADLIGFHDIESWPKAGEQWLNTMTDEEMDCPDCVPAKARAARASAKV
jgi:NADH dehydrogenase